VLVVTLNESQVDKTVKDIREFAVLLSAQCLNLNQHVTSTGQQTNTGASKLEKVASMAQIVVGTAKQVEKLLLNQLGMSENEDSVLLLL
jgi:flagellar motor switch protein FliG